MIKSVVIHRIRKYIACNEMELSSVGFNYVPKRNVVVIEGIK